MNRACDHLLLTKGLEEEVYTGRRDGTVAPLADRIAAAMPEYHTEPDARNVEFTTRPYRDYECVVGEVMEQRLRLRDWLNANGGYTLVQGGTMALETSDEFHISDPDNPYYRFIRDTYGRTVVTASSHLNIGIPDVATLMRAYRVIRCEASLFLALTAASPFLRGEATGYHSTRWKVFPQTPANVPLFADHGQFVQWVEGQLASGAMYNPRHLWLSVRPNGPDTPYELTRLELRICDRASHAGLLKGLLALLEARVWQVIEDADLDPLKQAHHPAVSRADDLVKEALANEDAVATDSMYASITDWRTGQTVGVREWIEQYVEMVLPTAAAHGFDEYLGLIRQVLEVGNTAQQWLRLHARGHAVADIIERANRRVTDEDVATKFTVC